MGAPCPTRGAPFYYWQRALSEHPAFLPPPPPLPSPTPCAERKLNFLVGVIQACQRVHAEAARAAAAAQRPPVAPYVSHYSLAPASASTRWKVRGQEREERAPSDANLAALLPARAFSVPTPAERPSSDRVYSRGMSAQEVTEAGLKDAAFRVRAPGACSAAPSFARARAHTLCCSPPHPHNTSHNTCPQFLSDAVALGTGAASSLASRRAQALHDALFTAPALASATSGAGAASAGWRARAAADAAHLAAGGGLQGLSQQALPPTLPPSQEPLLRAAPRGRATAARAHPPGMHAGTGTGAVRDFSCAQRVAGVAGVLGEGAGEEGGAAAARAQTLPAAAPM